MATSVALSTDNSNIKYKITITQNTQSVSGNTSNVTVSVRFYRTNTGYTTYGSGTVYCKINGTTYSASVTSDDKITSSGIVLFSKTLTISHNADGTKTLTASAWIDHSQVTSKEQSYDQALTTIPRATTPSVNDSDINLGESVTISTPRASGAFTHTLKYSFGGASGTIATGVATSRTWTIPLSLATNIPNATSGKLTISCETYNGSTKIGTKSVVITVRVPASVVPTISSVAITDTNSTQYTKMGGFVKGKSDLSVKITASGAQGSKISSYSTIVGDRTYAGATFTVSDINTAGTLTFTVTVKDSRGRTAKETKTVTIVNYETPSITKFSVIRSNADGTPNDEGTSLRVTYGFTIASVNSKNDKSYKLEIKAPESSSYTTIASGSVYSLDTNLIVTDGISIDSSYTIRLTVADYFRTLVHTVEAPTAFTLMDFHASGKGISIGKVAEEVNLFDVNLPTRFRKEIEVDSDWVELTLNTEFFALYSDNSAPRVKSVGGFISIIGAVTPTKEITSSAEGIVIASGIPAKYRPPITLNFVCQGSGMNKWLFQVNANGNILFSRYGTTEYIEVVAGNWLPFAVSYAI